ncbi:MAG: hypothetical protein KC912_08255 [Proteobacteria bacterium]|nr:hypothetical protein [Pseudomonadota bacterium]
MDEATRPTAVLAIQYMLLGQAVFDVVMGASAGAYYAWIQTVLQNIPSAPPAYMVPAAGLVPFLGGAVLAASGLLCVWGLATRRPWAWLISLAIAGVHLVLNPCCSPLSLVIIGLLIRTDVREWVG